MHETTPQNDRLETSDPSVLVAIAVAAHKTGDKLLEQVARRELEERHQISIRFTRQKKGVASGS